MQSLNYLLVLFVIANSLHTQIHPIQQLVGYDMKAELLKLEAQHNNFEAVFQKMKQSLEIVTAKATEVNNTEKVNLLESAILRQRQEIYLLSTQILPPFNLSKCSCENLTDKEKVLMLSDLDGVKKRVQDVRETLKSVPRCQKIDALNKDVDKQLFFVQSMEDILYAKCLKVLLLSPTIYQTNLYVDNWILGDQTADEVVDQYYQRSLRYHNVTNCPLAKPFFVGTECILCDQPSPVFNLLQRRCVSCGPGGSVDKTTRKCVNTGIVFKNNYEAPNYSLEGLDGIPPSPKNAIQTCPLDTPFFNGNKCIACPSPLYFSVLNAFCKKCSNGLVFDTINKKCSNIPKFSTNFDAPNFIVPSNSTLQQFKNLQSQRIKEDPSIQTCQIETPYSTGQKCISCLRDPYLYFNIFTKKCTSCPGNSTYDSEHRRCFSSHNITQVQTIPITTTKTVTGDQYISNIQNNKNWITNDGNSNRVLDEIKNKKSDNIKECPEQTPFFNGQKCISCESYFNFDSKQCQTCRQDTLFNSNLHKCESSGGTFQTNPIKASNLIFDGISYQQYKNTYQINISNDPNIKDCPSQTPYWNGKQCISCSQSTPFFNLDGKVCQDCSFGSKYNKQTRQCEDAHGKYINQAPTIANLI